MTDFTCRSHPVLDHTVPDRFTVPVCFYEPRIQPLDQIVCQYIGVAKRVGSALALGLSCMYFGSFLKVCLQFQNVPTHTYCTFKSGKVKHPDKPMRLLHNTTGRMLPQELHILLTSSRRFWSLVDLVIPTITLDYPPPNILATPVRPRRSPHGHKRRGMLTSQPDPLGRHPRAHRE